MESGVGVILVAAGAGTRFGAPKALVRLAGQTLVERAAAAFSDFEDRVVVLRAEDLDCDGLAGWRRVAGGPRRRDSVANGLEALDPGTRAVLVHDAARPLVTRALVERVCAAPGAAVIPVVSPADTIKRVAGDTVVETLDRATLAAVQTPQRFDVALLRRALAATAGDATDEAALVERLGAAVRTVAGDRRNLKVTGPADLAVAEALLSL